MADADGGAGRAGEVRLPAVFQGTIRLADPDERPAPMPAPRDDLVGRFVADLELDHAMLLQAGFVPVHPSHPAYARHLAASIAPPAAPVPHDPLRSASDTVRLPFSTTIEVTPEMALRHGLTAPGSAATLAPPATGGSVPTTPVLPPPPSLSLDPDARTAPPSLMRSLASPGRGPSPIPPGLSRRSPAPPRR